MRSRLLFLPAILLSILASAAQPATSEFDLWVDELTAAWLRPPPGTAEAPTPPAAATPADEDEQTDNPMETYEARRQRTLGLAANALERLKQWPADTLTPTQRVSASLLKWNFEIMLEGDRFAGHRFVFNQSGLHVSLVSTIAERGRLQQRADVERYLERLGQVANRIDEGIARARAAADRGLIPPRYILERAREQVVMFLEPAPAQNLFVSALERRSGEIKNLAPEARVAAIARATRMVADEVKPAYERVRACLDALLPPAKAEVGLTQLPDGAAAYAHALRKYTTTRMTAEEIHALGLREVARVEGEMDRLLREMGQTEGSVRLRYAKISLGEVLPAEPDPRSALIARYTEIIRDAEKRSAALFDLTPRAPVEVRRVPALTERTAAAHYTSPTPDGSRPGIFWLPLPGSAFSYTARMRSLAYHEGVPGHHFQLALQAEQKELPRFRARRTFGGISAHSEGWGLYAERLAVEQGWYEGDKFGLLGALDSELFRARRLVVDTGLHAKGWTRQQGIDYGISAREVERYIANPGQACAYMIGMLHILQEREKAKAALGNRFSLASFHRNILKTGTVPLAVLTEVIDEWIASQQGSAAVKKG